MNRSISIRRILYGDSEPTLLNLSGRNAENGEEILTEQGFVDHLEQTEKLKPYKPFLLKIKKADPHIRLEVWFAIAKKLAENSLPLENLLEEIDKYGIIFNDDMLELLKVD